MQGPLVLELRKVCHLLRSELSVACLTALQFVLSCLRSLPVQRTVRDYACVDLVQSVTDAADSASMPKLVQQTKLGLGGMTCCPQ